MSAQPAPTSGEEPLRLRAAWPGVTGARRSRVLAVVGLLTLVLMALVYGIATSGRATPPPTAAVQDTAPGGGGEWLKQVPDTPRGTPPPPDPAPPSGTTPSTPQNPPPNPATSPASVTTGPPPAAKPPTPEEQYRQDLEKKRQEALLAALTAPPVAGAGAPPQGNAGTINSGVAGSRENLPGSQRTMIPSDLSGGAGSDEDAQNKQAQKAAFLANAESRRIDGYLDEARTAPISAYEVKAGTVIPAVMLSGINSDLPGSVVAQVRANVYDYVSARHVLIPQGSRLVGRYDSQIAYGQERVLLVWERIIFPDGSSLTLKGMPGVDSQGQGGSADRVDNHYGKLFGGVILSSILGIGAQAAYGPHVNTSDPSIGQLGMQGMASSVNQVGQQITRKNLNIQPTLVIRPGYLFNVLVSRDLVLPAYPQESN